MRCAGQFEVTNLFYFTLNYCLHFPGVHLNASTLTSRKNAPLLFNFVNIFHTGHLYSRSPIYYFSSL